MLRISAQEAPGHITLRLEGSLTGHWVAELEIASAKMEYRTGGLRRIKLKARG